MDDKELINKILESKPIAYRAEFARISGSVTAGVMLSQAMYWRGKSSKYQDGAFEKNSKECEIETALTEKQQRTARHILEQKGFMSFRRGGAHGAMVCTVHTEAVYSAIRSYFSECPKGSSDPENVQKAEPELPKGHSRTDERPFSPYREYSENTHREENADAFMPRTFEQSNPKNTIKITTSEKELAKPIYEILDKLSPPVEHSKTLTKKIVRAINKHGLEKIKKATLARCAYQAAKGRDPFIHQFFTDDDAIEWHSKGPEKAESQLSTLPVYGEGEVWYG